MNINEFNFFKEHGYRIFDELYSVDEVERMNVETNELIEKQTIGKVFEDDGFSVRSINGPHLNNTFFDNLASDKRLLKKAESLLGGEVYIHQYKINIKKAFLGQRWEWHSDYWFWKKEDGMPENKALTAAIYLDDITEFNGPMFLIPRTHEDVLTDEIHSKPYGQIDGGNQWEITTSEMLKYQLSHTYIERKINSNGIVSAKGSKGDVLFFHGNILHCSSSNSSPWDRKCIFISYNLVDNALNEVQEARPEFLASRKFTTLQEKSVF